MNCHSKIYSLVLPAGLLISSTLTAETFRIEPRADVGVQSYDFSFDDVADIESVDPVTAETIIAFGDGIDVSDDLFYGGAGISLQFDRVFFDISGQMSLEGRDSGDQALVGLDVTGDGVGNFVASEFEAEFDRAEINFSVGYSATDDLAAYIGYKYSRTKFDDRLDVNPQVLAVAPAAGVFNGDINLDFNYSGPFFGVSYSTPVEFLYGSLIFTSSIAFLDGEFDQEFSSDDPLNGAAAEAILTVDNEGDSVGVNVGVQWNGSFGPSFDGIQYYIGVDRSQYEFDSDTNADFEEEITRYKIGLKYGFSIWD